MEAYKVENYERSHGVGTFVPFRHLLKEEDDRICGFLKMLLGLPYEVGPESLVKAICDKSTLVRNVNAESDDFDLQQVLNKLEFGVSETVYLNWYRLDDIDELRTEDLFKVFGDLWYPASDDLDIVDSRMHWLVSIEHSGTVRALRLDD